MAFKVSFISLHGKWPKTLFELQEYIPKMKTK